MYSTTLPLFHSKANKLRESMMDRTILSDSAGFSEAINARNTRNMYLDFAIDLPVFWLMENAFRTNCLDPRDRIYGVLAIGSDVNDLQIQPDYSASVENVYTQF